MTETKSMLEEFKKFALKGSLIDLAIGIIIGGAFSGLINSLVNDIMMPIIGWLTGGIDFSNMFLQLSGQREHTLAAARTVGATIAYGHFITLAINFLIIAWILFMVVKAINVARGIGTSSDPAKPEALPRNEQLLTEIRDLLQQKLK